MRHRLLHGAYQLGKELHLSEIRMTNPTEFFEYIEKKHGTELPVLSAT